MKTTKTTHQLEFWAGPYDGLIVTEQFLGLPPPGIFLEGWIYDCNGPLFGSHFQESYVRAFRKSNGAFIYRFRWE